MTNSIDDSRPVRIDENKEIRFAVVMYGGVSLAVYMNGITQELLKMVRSTAKNENSDALLKNDQLESTEKIYRKLCCLMGNQELSESHARWAKSHAASEPDKDPLEIYLHEGGELHNRFIVDIISGTSAGGINGIYLAKALANTQQIGGLKKLWIDEGDISVLINDKFSYEGLNIPVNDLPESLLNSRRMYLKLLESLQSMGGADSEKGFSPSVDELDLFITTTDIRGTVVPLQLADKLVFEKRYKNVFHFKYDREQVTDSAPRNEFTSEYNPFLAFAARCTSSFPFAFEPMTLNDIDKLLPGSGNDAGNCSKSKLWKKFFTQRMIDDHNSYINRAFGDGGYLDNKPFSYATQTLKNRSCSVPVDRILLYIEPSPEHPVEKENGDRKPDAIENVKAAVLDLPGYETIREDLQFVQERNGIIQRVNRIIKGVENDLLKCFEKDGDNPSCKSSGSEKPMESEDWAKLDLADMVEQKGIYYLPYRRLRISDLTDEIALLVARLMNFDPDSAIYTVVRCIIRVWRERNFVDYHIKGKDKETVNKFLYRYDLKYRIRRFHYINKMIDQLYSDDNLLYKEMAKLDSWLKFIDYGTEDAAEKYNEIKEKIVLAHEKENRVLMREALLSIKRRLNVIYKEVRKKARGLQSRDEKKNNFAADLKKTGINSDVINKLLGVTGPDCPVENSALHEDDCYKRTEDFLNKNEGIFKALCDTAKKLEDELEAIFKYSSLECRKLLDPLSSIDNGTDKIDLDSDCSKIIRAYLWHYYMKFDDYDQLIFPIVYQAGVGESDYIDIYRISPEDADALVKDGDTGNPGNPRKKLAGTSLYHFGAFLEKAWRQNDIMWGRLDGAERLITVLLPPGLYNEKSRTALIREAHEIILREELIMPKRNELCQLLVSSLIRISSGESHEKAVENVLKKYKGTVKSEITDILLNSLDTETIVKVLKEGYEIDRGLEPRFFMHIMARSANVIGKMLKKISEDRKIESKAIRWISRIAGFFCAFVELSTPDSIANLLFMHWMKLVYFFEAMLIIGGTLLSYKNIQIFGISFFIITLVVNFLVLLLKDKMRKKNLWFRILIFFMIAAAVVLILAGVFTVWGLFYNEHIWQFLENARGNIQNHILWKWTPAFAVAFIFLISIFNDIKAWIKKLF